MRTLLPLLLLSSALLAACVADSDPAPHERREIGRCAPDVTTRPDVEVVDLDGAYLSTGDAPASGDATWRDPELVLAPGAEPDVCACADNECLVDWIEDTLGCGACAHIVCADGPIGGCVPCIDDNAQPGDAADEPCILDLPDEVAQR